MTDGAVLLAFCGIIGRCSPSTVLTFNSVGTGSPLLAGLSAKVRQKILNWKF